MGFMLSKELAWLEEWNKVKAVKELIGRDKGWHMTSFSERNFLLFDLIGLAWRVS